MANKKGQKITIPDFKDAKEAEEYYFRLHALYTKFRAELDEIIKEKNEFKKKVQEAINRKKITTVKSYIKKIKDS